MKILILIFINLLDQSISSGLVDPDETNEIKFKNENLISQNIDLKNKYNNLVKKYKDLLNSNNEIKNDQIQINHLKQKNKKYTRIIHQLKEIVKENNTCQENLKKEKNKFQNSKHLVFDLKIQNKNFSISLENCQNAKLKEANKNSEKDQKLKHCFEKLDTVFSKLNSVFEKYKKCTRKLHSHIKDSNENNKNSTRINNTNSTEKKYNNLLTMFSKNKNRINNLESSSKNLKHSDIHINNHSLTVHQEFNDHHKHILVRKQHEKVFKNVNHSINGEKRKHSTILIGCSRKVSSSEEE